MGTFLQPPRDFQTAFFLIFLLCDAFCFCLFVCFLFLFSTGCSVLVLMGVIYKYWLPDFPLQYALVSTLLAVFKHYENTKRSLGTISVCILAS